MQQHSQAREEVRKTKAENTLRVITTKEGVLDLE